MTNTDVRPDRPGGATVREGPQGLLGFRPLSGLRTTDGRRIRAGMLFRSATPQFVSGAEARAFTDATGLRTIVDMRLPHEAKAEGSGGFTDCEVRVINCPFTIRQTVAADSAVAPMPGADPLIGTYLQYLQDRSAFTRIVQALCGTGSTPALIHCTVGKDRTGVACAILLDAIGVLRHDISSDYVAKVDDVKEMMSRLRGMKSYGDAVDVYPPEAYEAVPATILRFLAWVDVIYGGARAYLLANGVTDDQLDAFAQRILEQDEGDVMAEVSHSIVLNASVEDTWKVVGDVGNVHKWVPAIASTRMDGDVRIATFADGGGEARERIVSHSDADRTYTYSYLEGPIPLDEYTSTLTVSPHHDGPGAFVSWTATLQAAPEVVASIDELYRTSLAELKEILEG